MRVLLGLVLGATVLALAFWAYQENYRTREVLAEVRGVQGEIGRLQEQLSVLRAEWAYLNRPDRLRDLTTLNFDRLGLLPMEPGQFVAADQVAYPAPEIPAIIGPVPVQGEVDPADSAAADVAVASETPDEGL